MKEVLERLREVSVRTEWILPLVYTGPLPETLADFVEDANEAEIRRLFPEIGSMNLDGFGRDVVSDIVAELTDQSWIGLFSHPLHKRIAGGSIGIHWSVTRLKALRASTVRGLLSAAADWADELMVEYFFDGATRAMGGSK